MGLKSVVLAGSLLMSVTGAVAQEVQLPPEVTPQLRAACETDVRRLCLGPSPTVAKVKSCVAAKFFQLGRRCQVELASLGFGK